MKRTLLLRPVNKSNNRAGDAVRVTYSKSSGEQSCEQGGIQKRLRTIRAQLEGLSAGYSPAFNSRVQEILTSSPPTDQAMLDAWTRIGHGDAVRSPRIDLITANESSVSPLGVACLISYARGYLDELESTAEVAARLSKQEFKPVPQPDTPTLFD